MFQDRLKLYKYLKLDFKNGINYCYCITLLLSTLEKLNFYTIDLILLSFNEFYNWKLYVIVYTKDKILF